MMLLFSNDAKNVRVDGWLFHYYLLSDDDSTVLVDGVVLEL